MLSSVFGDLYSQDVLQDDTIINLETSRTHDPDFHDYYVQLLNEAGIVMFSIETDLLLELAEICSCCILPCWN